MRNESIVKQLSNHALHWVKYQFTETSLYFIGVWLLIAIVTIPQLVDISNFVENIKL